MVFYHFVLSLQKISTMSRDNSNILQRNEMLFRNYLRVLKDLGSNARYIPLSVKYERAAMPFSISTDRASRIITRMIRDKSQRYLTDSECEELLNDLESLNVIAYEQICIDGVDRILNSIGVSLTHEELKRKTQEYLIKYL